MPQQSRTDGASRGQDPRAQVRALGAELLGTFALTLVGAGAVVIGAVSGGEVPFVARVVAPGLLVMAMIYTIGDISGAHINPAVTLAFAVRGVFRWRLVPGYWAAQFAGALLAAAVLRALFGTAGNLGVTLPHHGDLAAFVMEVLLTLLLVLVIIGTATRSKLTGANAAVAVGATIALDGLFAAPISGASMNPARSLGPAIVGGTWTGAWIYVAAPVLGALLAVAIIWLLAGPPDPEEVKKAEGDQDAQVND